ncbi:MAG: hypothetical protein LBS50_02445 [Prevotellaceae bacterium]|jgi:uncharacterized protein (TIGR00661 family)|nr:hypothetical protein [Prevotellaceae bacterium]
MKELPLKSISSAKRILVAPLDWGLGHATRCVPIIYALLEEGKEVILAASGVGSEFLKKEFPTLQIIDFKGINIKYSKSNSQVWTMIMQIPHILFNICIEHFKLKKIIQKFDIQAVISDNRFGLWNKNIYSIYITHQISIKVSKNSHILTNFMRFLHKLFILRYDECWIPDFEGENNLSGELSHGFPLPKNAVFIEILSRFQNLKIEPQPSNYQYVAIISGVEPQRTILEEKLTELFLQTNKKCLIIEGKPAQNIEIQHINKITIISHLADEKLAQTLKNAEKIYCRSGYSTLMDLYALGIKTAVLIPTAGQTEQEYLAEYFEKKGFEIMW